MDNTPQTLPSNHIKKLNTFGWMLQVGISPHPCLPSQLHNLNINRNHQVGSKVPVIHTAEVVKKDHLKIFPIM